MGSSIPFTQILLLENQIDLFVNFSFKMSEKSDLNMYKSFCIYISLSLFHDALQLKLNFIFLCCCQIMTVENGISHFLK